MRPTSTKKRRLAAAGVGLAFALLTVGHLSISASASDFQKPSVILGEGDLLGHSWQTGARTSRDLGRGRPCFWIRTRSKADLEIPAEWCGGPRGLPHFAAIVGNGRKRITVELIVAPKEVTTVRLTLKHAPDRTISMDLAPKSSEHVGLRRNFSYTTQLYKGKSQTTRTTYLDEAGNVAYEYPSRD